MDRQRLKQRFKKAGKRLLYGIGGAIILFFLLDLIFPVHTDVAYAPIVLARDGSVLHAYLTPDQQWRMKTSLKELTPELRQAILFKEDRYFYTHPGVNILAVGRAAFNNVFHLKRTSGASTITMQVARLLTPKKRTYWNKVVEMFRATQLELHCSKDEILELYLNLVPYGSNIQGVKAASILYFNKTPDQLSLAELTALSIIPNRPNSLVMGRDNVRIILERNKWLERFKEAKLFPAQTIADAEREPLTAYRHPAPAAVPQLSLRLRRYYPAAMQLKSTIDAGIQTKAENLVTNYVNALRLRNVYNASVIIVDNQTHEVRAYIGSPDFGDRAHNGQVDGVQAQRSPGSTLKPYLYGLSFDNGINTPHTVIADVPINLSGYTPENYDLTFRGNVTVEDALRQSLNIPAVKTLQQLTVPRFTQGMARAGFLSVWQQRKKLGLSMILGGCTVRLDELTALFCSFANGGRFAPLQWLAPEGKPRSSGDTVGHSVAILSPEANYMVTRILCELIRPDLPNMIDGAKGIPKVGWKTGTSYGRKDAWSIGFNAHFTIGVWLGNFSGQGVTDLSGAATATPLLFQLFNAIDADAGKEWLHAPADAAQRLVCKETGKVPADFCTEQVMDDYIPGISSNARCDHQREVWVSADESFSYCTTCLPATGYKTKWYPNISPELTAYYDAHHIAYQQIPPHNPACSRVLGCSAPAITSLTNGATYIIVDKGKQQLTLECTAANDVAIVYWYLNDHFFAAAKVGQKLFFNPDGPEVKVSCTDDKGRNADVVVKVRFM